MGDARARRLRRLLAASVTVLTVLAGCGDDDSRTADPLGEDTASSDTSTESGFTDQDPAVVVTALQKAGVKICDELHLAIPNQSYKYEDSRTLKLTLANGACHNSIEDMEAEPSHGFLDLERFLTADDRDAGIEVHSTELVTGTAKGDYNPAKVMWSYGMYLLVLSDGTTGDVETAVVNALAGVPEATHVYSSPRALPR